MSAWMCGAAHWTALADRISEHDPRTPQEIFTILAEENKKSIDARYAHVIAQDPDYMYDHTDPFSGGYREGFDQKWAPGEIITLARCYAYQSCEHFGWDTSEAASLIDALITREAGSEDPDVLAKAAEKARGEIWPNDYQSSSLWGIHDGTVSRLTALKKKYLAAEEG